MYSTSVELLFMYFYLFVPCLCKIKVVLSFEENSSLFILLASSICTFSLGPSLGSRRRSNQTPLLGHAALLCTLSPEE